MAAGPGAADDPCLSDRQCRSQYDQAVEHFEQGRFEQALEKFQAAYELRRMPWLQINIGRTLHRLGRPQEALEHYEVFKQAETKPDPETQERVEKYIAQAKALADTKPALPTVAQPPVQPPPTQPPAEPPPPKPIYKKGWFWAVIGGGVAAAVIVGVAVGVSTRKQGLPDGVMTLKFTF